MSEVADLWNRIEEAKKRLGVSDEAQIEQIQSINQQVKEIRAGLSGRFRELERHREEVSRLRHENEQLKRMLHRLLLAIEQRYSGRLKDIVKDLESQVSALVPLTAGPKDGASPDLVESPGTRAPAEDKSAPPVAPAAPVAPLKGNTVIGTAPSEKDSRWLHEIMERARELTHEDAKGSRVVSPIQSSHSAVA